MEYNASTINSFFNQYPFTRKTASNAIDHIYFEKIIPKIISAKEERSTTPPNLNIFEGFNLGSNELKHCSILSWFFNPSANHCQGELFLNIFLEKYYIEDVKKYTDGGYFQVTTEDCFTSNGRVDIIISNNDFCFIIEAKILASDQDNQIKRYNNILEQQAEIFGIPSERCKLFYLTVEGKQPSSGKADFCITWRQISTVLMTFATKSNNEYISLTAKQYANYICNYL